MMKLICCHHSLKSLTSLLLVLIIFSTCDGFVVSSSSSDRRHHHIFSGWANKKLFTKSSRIIQQSALENQKRTQAIKKSMSSSLSLSSSSSSPSLDERNMFHDYDKPILLLGCSGPGQEISKIANSFVAEHFGSSNNNGLIDVNSNNNDLVQMIQQKKYTWPQVITIDFSNDKDNEQKNIELAQSLYDIGLLSVYVNVHSESSNMDNASVNIKSRLDKDVFVKYSDYELCVKDEGLQQEIDNDDDDNDWEHVQWEFSRLLARARLVPAIPGDTKQSVNTAHLTMGEHTFFLSLSFPEISQVEPYVEAMCADVDAMEYRTDLLECRDNRFDLLYGMQLLRKYCRPHVIRVAALPFMGQVIEDVMPIVYTVRTQNQAGTYPDDEEGIAKMFDMLEWGLRGGVEVLDVESAWDKTKTDMLLSYAQARFSSQILGSHHVVGTEITTEQAVGLFHNCALDGRAHGAKVVLSIDSSDKDRMAYEAAIISASLAKASGRPVIPNISLILGDVGQFSRYLNFPFTPVTHESLPFKAAPGQLTANEILAGRILTNLLTGRNYVILGHNISYSVSPKMQGTAFAATRLPHKYGLADVETVEEFIESDFFKDSVFGGCSVTIPHKQAIIPHLDVLSDAAKDIGSVNTVIVKEEYVEDVGMKRVLYGDNTDWKGIFNPLERKLCGRIDPSKDFALILGGGGTARAAAYTAAKLGLQRLYYNRTPSKAQVLADTFGGTVLTSLDKESSNSNNNNDENVSLGDIIINGNNNNSLKVVISTLPAAAEFTLPEWVLEDSLSLPIIFDVNYKPYYTELLRQAEACNCDVVRGSEMLWEQGVGQFEAWTQRTAPYRVMKAIVLKNCLPEELGGMSDKEREEEEKLLREGDGNPNDNNNNEKEETAKDATVDASNDEK